MKTLLALAVLWLPVQAEKKAHPLFDQLKKLEGTWDSDNKDHPCTILYKVSSGGSILVETIKMGNGGEMVTVYHPDGDCLAMTHYCMLGNQPQLRLTGADAHQLSFSLAKGSGIDVAHDQHMHALSLNWTDPDHVTQVWTCYEGGKAKEATTIALSRVR